MTNKFMEITKRNGIKVPFDSDKITSAIEKAIVASKEDIEEKSVHPTAQEGGECWELLGCWKHPLFRRRAT